MSKAFKRMCLSIIGEILSTSAEGKEWKKSSKVKYLTTKKKSLKTNYY